MRDAGFTKGTSGWYYPKEQADHMHLGAFTGRGVPGDSYEIKPDNVHWDPAYTEVEVNSVMQRAVPGSVPDPGGDTEVMADHGTSSHHSS